MLIKDFILEELRKIWPKKISSKNVLICCPYHHETKPSLSIALENTGKVPAGAFNCFGCEAHGWWNKLAKELGLKFIDREKIEPENPYHLMYKGIKKTERKYVLPDNLFEWDIESWRGLKKEFLMQFQPAKQFDDNNMEWRIFFPILQDNELLGHLSEKINKKSSSPKHIFSVGLPISKILYPLDLHVGNTVILVEGLVDMLRLRREGLPALCFFGVNGWKAFKAFTLHGLVENVIACGDGDPPGWAVNSKIFNDLKKDFTVEIFNIPSRKDHIKNFNKQQLLSYIEKDQLPLHNADTMEADLILEKLSPILENLKGYDPGNMPTVYVRQLKKIVKKVQNLL